MTGPPENGVGWRTKFVLLGLSLVFASLVGAALGEALMRYREWNRSSVPGTMPFLFYPHARLGHALVRDASYFGWVTVNRQGFRGSEVSVENAEDGPFRIMVVGGSTTFDTFVSADSLAWPAQLQKHLNRASPGETAEAYEVINAGVPGYRVFDNMIRLQTELHLYEPDLLIVYHAHNDLFHTFSNPDPGLEAIGQRTPHAIRPASPWTRWLEENSLLYGKVRGRLRAIRSTLAFRSDDNAQESSAREGVDRSMINRAVVRFERDLRSFLAVTKAQTIPTAVLQVVHVTGVGNLEEEDPRIRRAWSRAVPAANPETVLAAYDRFSDVLRSSAAASDVRFLSTTELEVADIQYFAEGDPIHFNDQGARVMGREVAKLLSNEDLIP